MSTTYNKVTIDGTTLIDLSGDTVSDASHIRYGYKGHLNDGTEATGTYTGTSPTLVTKSVTANGTYNASDDSADGYSTFTVNVSGSSPVKTATGTFTGNGTRTVDITCNFEPDLIYWTSDPGTTASSGTVAGVIAREMMSANRYRNNSTTNSHYAAVDITAMNTGGSSYSFRATYENSTVTLYCFSNNARSLFTSGRTYTYKFVKWTS